MNPPTNDGPDSAENRMNAWRQSLRKLEAVYRISLSDETRAIYFEHLAHVKPAALEAAVNRCIAGWEPAYGVQFPPVKVVLDFVREAAADLEAEASRQRMLSQGDKPGDWPEDPVERDAVIAEQRQRHQAFMAELERTAQRTVFTAYNQSAEDMARERNNRWPYQPCEDAAIEAIRLRHLAAWRGRKGSA